MNFKRLSGLALIGTSTGLLLGGSSCSVIVNDFPPQCETTQDCIDLANNQPLLPNGEPSVSGLVCSDEKVCVPESGCHSNAECQDAHNGEPYLCRASDRTCQPLILKSKEDGSTICDVLADPADFRNQDTIWIGASVIFAPGSYQGLEMVRQDFNKLANGLPPATATSTKRRPLAFVYCEADPTLEEGAQHLVNDLELPIVITSLDTTSEIALLTKYSIANGKQVFQVSTSAGGPLLKTVDNQGMLVDLVLINENYDKETVELVTSHYVPYLRSTGAALGPKELPRVAVIHSSTPTYANTASKVIAALEEAKNTSKVMGFGYGDSDNPSGTPAAYASVVSSVLAFKPHLIVMLGGEEIGPDEETNSDGIDVPIEAGWAAAAGGQPPPQWLGILGSVGQLPKDMRTLSDPAAQTDWGSRSLFIQQHYDFNGPLFTSYINQLKQLIGADDPNDVVATEQTSPYNEFLREGAYLTAYSIALVAAQGKPFTGANVAAAARTFGSKNSAKFTVGLDQIFPALKSVADTKQPFFLENFQGWDGFDENGFATYPFADDVACLTPDMDDMGSPTVGELQPTGGIFETASGALTGTVSLTGCVSK